MMEGPFRRLVVEYGDKFGINGKEDATVADLVAALTKTMMIVDRSQGMVYLIDRSPDPNISLWIDEYAYPNVVPLEDE